MYFQCGKYRLSLERPLIMGVINITPDYFSDGGRFATRDAAIAQARRQIDEGADILDFGGESTRPGSDAVPLDEERRRILPVLDALRDVPVPLSVDTQKPELMREAIAAGAAMINDINALRAPGALEAVAATDAGVCFMHMQGDPKTMQHDPHYDDVVAEVRAFLGERLAAARAAGMAGERLAIDPGFGFGKTLEHNLALLRHLRELGGLGAALVAGLSRKSPLGLITGRAVDERVHASVAAMLMAVQRGAHIVRVHDVAATRDALMVLAAVQGLE